jgi:predicted nucleotidyltransferase component of viral defense system
MAKQTPPDIAKLVRRQLLALATERHDDFNLVLIRYGLERLLYRLSQSEHGHHFILKGALLFSVWGEAGYRATKDMDLLAHGAPDISCLKSMFTDVCATSVAPDGMSFDTKTMKVREIREDTEYGGVRIELPGRCGTDANMRLQVDIGFGDAVVPEPQEVEYPAMLLSLLPPPRIRVYPREVVIAEKLHAMVQLGMSNSRMKDFFDIHFLSVTFPFDGATLCGAIDATFARRRASIPEKVPLALTPLFAADPLKISQWQGFLRRSRLAEQLSLTQVIAQLERFLMPLLQTLGRGTACPMQWPPGGGWEAG